MEDMGDYIQFACACQMFPKYLNFGKEPNSEPGSEIPIKIGPQTREIW